MQHVLSSFCFMTCPCRHCSWEAILWFNAGISWSRCVTYKHFHPDGGVVRGGVQCQSLQHPGAHPSRQQLKVLHASSAFCRPQRAAEGKILICTLQTSWISKLDPFYCPPHPTGRTRDDGLQSSLDLRLVGHARAHSIFPFGLSWC